MLYLSSMQYKSEGSQPGRQDGGAATIRILMEAELA